MVNTVESSLWDTLIKLTIDIIFGKVEQWNCDQIMLLKDLLLNKGVKLKLTPNCGDVRNFSIKNYRDYLDKN